MPEVINQEVVKLVLHRIDELTQSGASTIFDEDIVGAELQYSVHEVVLQVPKTALLSKVKKWDGNNDEVVTGSVLEIDKPDDFLLLFKLKLSCWNNPVLDLGTYDEMDAICRGQHGTQFNSKNPFASFGINADADEVIACYPASADAEVEYMQYIPTLEAADLPDRLRDACAWDTASRLLASDKDWTHLAGVAEQRKQIILRRVLNTRSTSYRMKPRLFG